MVAYAVVVIIKCFQRITNIAQLSAIVVDKSLRNIKIGNKLLQHVENYSRAYGCVKIQSTSGMQASRWCVHRFYLKHGYKADATQYFVKEL